MRVTGFQRVAHEALSSWRIMFLVLGCVTTVAGVWAVFYMPDSPMDVSWLTEAEKRVAIQRVAVNQVGRKDCTAGPTHERVRPALKILTLSGNTSENWF
jgi:sugar phosphate permease